MYKAKNNAYSTLAISISDTDTIVVVQSGKGALFDPVSPNHTYATIENASGSKEVVKVTARTGDSLTIERGKDGTLAQSWNIGDIIECRPCAAAFADYEAGAQINGSSAKATPIDTDLFGIIDSAASWALKKLSWANIKATLKTYFDTIYAVSSDIQSQAATAFTTGGISTAYTGAPVPAIANNNAGKRFRIKFHAASGAAPTLAVSGLSAMSLRYVDNTGAKIAVAAGQIPADWVADVESDGTYWVVLDIPAAWLNAAQSFTKAQRGAIVALTDGATITPDFSAGNNFSVTLGGNRTLANPTNVVAGQSGVIAVTQDATGSRTLAYGANFDYTGGSAPVLSTAANAVDLLTYYARSSTSIWIGIQKGVA